MILSAEGGRDQGVGLCIWVFDLGRYVEKILCRLTCQVPRLCEYFCFLVEGGLLLMSI